MPAITLTDLTNAKRDADDLSLIVNGLATAPDVVTRLGTTTKTIAKAVASAQVGPVGPVGPIGQTGTVIGQDAQITTVNVGVEPVQSGLSGANGFGNAYCIRTEPSTITGSIRQIKVAAEVAQTGNVFVVTLNGDGTLTTTAIKPITLAAGINTIDILLPIQASQYVGIQMSIGPYALAGGTFPVWYRQSLITTNSTKTIGGNYTLQFKATIVGQVLSDILNINNSLINMDTLLDTNINGSLSGDLIIEGVGSVNPSIFRTSSLANGVTYKYSVEAKAKERSVFNIFSNNTAPNINCSYDLLNGTSSGVGSSIINLGNGWYRCVVQFTSTQTAISIIQNRIFLQTGTQPYIGNGVSGLYFNETSLLVLNTKNNLLTSSNDYSNSVWTKQNVTVSSNVAQFGGPIIPIINQPWLNSSHAALGTSITIQNNYITKLSLTLGTILTNLGVSGGSLGLSQTGHGGSLAIYNQIVNISSTTKLVTMEIGTNDFGDGAVSLGVFGDTTTATFYGALYAALIAIKTQAPNCFIVLMTPYSSDNRTPNNIYSRVRADGKKLLDFQKAIIETGEYFGWPVANFGQEGGVNFFTANALTSDGLHINAKGGGLMASYLASYINKFSPL
jgi:lysophospholipase L1-like esterase